MERDMSKKIAKNIIELRNIALESLEDLRSGKIEIEEAAVAAKICETVISSVRAELEYHKIVGTVPNIEFMGGYKITLNSQPKNKKLT